MYWREPLRRKEFNPKALKRKKTKPLILIICYSLSSQLRAETLALISSEPGMAVCQARPLPSKHKDGSK